MRYRHGTRQGEDSRHLARRDIRVLHRNHCRSHRIVNRPGDAEICREFRIGDICLCAGPASGSGILQFARPRRSQAKCSRTVAGSAHAHNRHSPDLCHAGKHPRHDGPLLRRHHQHPGARSRATDSVAARHPVEHTRTWMCRHLSARCCGSDNRRHHNAKALHQAQ